MNIGFNDEQMRAIVTKAIVEGMGEEQKAIIIQKAIESLMGPSNTDPYAKDKRSKLEVAFDNAANFALNQLAREGFQKPENIARMRALLLVVIDKIFAGEHAQTVSDAIATAIGDGMVKVRGY